MSVKKIVVTITEGRHVGDGRSLGTREFDLMGDALTWVAAEYAAWHTHDGYCIVIHITEKYPFS